MTELPRDLAGWKRLFDEHIEEARSTPMSDADRDQLIAYLRKEIELIAFGPEPVDAWADIGYRR